MNRLFSLCLAIVAGIFSVVADGVVTGVVTNKETEEVIDYAMVQLIDAKTDKATTIGGHTDEQGAFRLVKVPNGSYIVRISNLGFIPQERTVKIQNNKIDLGIIHLAEDTKVLQEVVVEGIRSQMRFELDRRVFTVDADIVGAGSSASELLESIPSVEVDQDGEVSLRGNSSVTVWINGKESGLTADNRAQILEQIPAETIERIEVITNPSAKYSPEGTAGIINIVLKKDRRGGYFGSAELGANTQGGMNASFNINYNNSRWDTYASIGFRMRHNKGESWSLRTYDDATYLNSDSESKNHGNNLFVRLGATYHLTDKDDFYVNGFGMFGHRWGHSTTNYISNVPGQWQTNLNRSVDNNDMRGLHAELGYTHKWSDKHYIDIMGAFNYWGGPRWNSYLQSQSYIDNDEDYNIYQEQEQEVGTNNWEAKLDYTNHLTEWLKLEAGFNGNYSHEDSPVTTLEGTSSSDMQLNPALYNRFIYNNNISALYLTLGGKWNKLSFSAGLRGEAWQVEAKSLGYGDTEQTVEPFKKNNFALFPSAYLSYSLPKDNELQINFTRRIRRPWGGQLNSFQNISDPTNIRYGNEELQPQYSYAFELNYLKSWINHMVSVSAYYRTTEDVMERISYMYGDVMYTTTENVSNSVSAGCEIVLKNSFFRNRLDLTTTANLYNYHLDAWEIDFDHMGTLIPVSGKSQDSFSWDIRCMANVRLPWGINFQVNGGYNARRISAQGSREPGWNVGAGLRKNVGNWSFSINCRDIFNSRKWHNITYGDGYVQESERWRGGFRMQFTVKYSFGNMKAQRTKNNASGAEMMEGSYEGIEMME